MIRLGVIDSGVSAQWLDTSPVGLAGWRDFTGADALEDRLGHGSAVATAVQTNGVCLWMARVFDDRLACPVSRITAAIEWLLGVGVDIINMSFGMARSDERLETLIAQALGRGVVMIAAAPAQGRPVYPSAFSGVIRATGDARCQPGQLSFLNSSQADFGGFPGNPARGPAGASIGCAYVTRIACTILREAQYIEATPVNGRKPYHQVFDTLRATAKWQGPECRGLL